MTDCLDRDRVIEAFDAAISYWHNQTDEPISEHAENDRPNTAREYFEEQRGFDTETVNEWRLGWAPADGGLYDYLDAEGFAADTIAATGLFCESAPQKELWRGRYIMPYFSADGRAEYAIARCTGSKGGGSAGYDGHSEDFLAGKYAKVAHTRENVPLSEPILGLHTLEDADEVVVAEGIADAISATEAGHAVLSPVTKEFKSEHFEAVVEAVKTHDIARVYVVPDAEQASFSEIDSDDVPDEPEQIYEAITQPLVAPGPGGGLRTANYLVEQGIDARVVDLPRPSGGKVDLDDYIQEWGQPLEPSLRSSKPPSEHPKYEAATKTQNLKNSQEYENGASAFDKKDEESEKVDVSLPDGAGSGLFDLDVGDVNEDLEADYRGKNPLGHTGDSENYFVVYEVDGTLFAKDYKRPGDPVYNGLTYLLVEVDERPVEDPSGSLSPWETWVAWREARKRGLLDSNDPIPTKALGAIAREHEFYDFEAIEDDLEIDDGELPPKAWNRALQWVNSAWEPEDEITRNSEGKVTSKTRRSRMPVTLRTWEDVQYIYPESKKLGRKAARDLLSSKYRFMTVSDSETLQIYDEETGIYTDKIGTVRGEIYEELGEYWSTHELNEITAGLRQENVVKPRHLDAGDLDEALVCVGNGVLDLFERELHDHSPEYHFVNRVPTNYDPDADTSVFEDFADDLVAREEDADTLFEMVGHALLPDANERYKKFLILTGDADNGKSMFYDAVSALLNGPDGEESNTSGVKLAKLAQNRFSIYSMYGSLANIAGEIDGKKIRNTANFKDITGGDEIEIEPKGQDSFFDTLGTTLMFAANDPPILGERDKKAIASRIVPIELPYTFVENPSNDLEKERVPERELRDKLEAEEALAGLLNLALDGLERLEDNHGDVSLPESPDERLERYERSADPMRDFGMIALGNDPDDYLVKADITTLYKQFAQERNYEIGSKIGPVLHGVLRGIDTLNYTDSKPRQPDYTDTGLPLKGWDERKEVVDRVTLSEEGLKLAEDAGLVVEDEDENEGEIEEEAPSGAVPVRQAAQSPTGYTNVTVEVLNVEQPDGKLAMKATVKDRSSAIDVKSWENADALSEGDTVLLKNAEVGQYDGSSELTIQEGVTEVVDIQSGVGFTEGAEPGEDQSQIESKAWATDGGTVEKSTESTPINGKVEKNILEYIRDQDDPAEHDSVVAAVAGMIGGVSPGKVEHRIEELKRSGDIYEPMSDHYRT